MKYDIVLAGVGGQGVLSLASVIGQAAQHAGLFINQSEVHGMSQRGGAVFAHLRLSDRPIASVQIPQGEAQMILSMELLEGLRYLSYLRPDGVLVTSTETVKNIPDYPEIDALYRQIETLPHVRLVDAPGLARQVGSARASNMVLIGAAARDLPVSSEILEQCIRDIFAKKGEKVVAINDKAFTAGQQIL